MTQTFPEYDKVELISVDSSGKSRLLITKLQNIVFISGGQIKKIFRRFSGHETLYCYM